MPAPCCTVALPRLSDAPAATESTTEAWLPSMIVRAAPFPVSVSDWPLTVSAPWESTIGAETPSEKLMALLPPARSVIAMASRRVHGAEPVQSVGSAAASALLVTIRAAPARAGVTVSSVPPRASRAAVKASRREVPVSTQTLSVGSATVR